jgi:hypothetical protein
MVIALLLFSSLLFAEDLSFERYCFSSALEAQKGKARFSEIQVPSDELVFSENCLSIKMRPHRRELIQRFLVSQTGARVDFTSEESRREPCRLKVETEKRITGSGTSGGLNQKGIFAQKNQSTQTATEVAQIQTLDEFELTVNQDQVKGVCRIISPERYEISLEVNKTPKLSPAVLPDGKIVYIQRPDDQETASLKTSVQLVKGSRIEIGALVKNLRDDSKTGMVKPDLKIETLDQQSAERVYLSLE